MSVAVATSETVAPAAATLSKVLCSGAMQNATAQVLAAAHAQIKEMHANSGSRAVGYVIVVLLLYALALAVALVKYVRQERYEARLYHIYDEFVRRDRFLRLSKRHSSVGHSALFAGVTSSQTTNCEEITPPLGTVTMGTGNLPLQIPQIHLPIERPRPSHPLSEDEDDDDEVPIQEELQAIRVNVPRPFGHLRNHSDSNV